MLDGVEVGDGEGVRHQGTCAGAAARPHGHAVVPGPADEVRHDEEVTGETHAGDHAELQLQARAVLLLARFPLGAGLGERLLQAQCESALRLRFQEALDCVAFRHREGRQVVLAQLQVEVAALGDLDGVLQGFRQVREQLGHLGGALQVLLFTVELGTARIVQHPAFLDADPGLVGLELVGLEEAHVVGGHHRHARAGSELHGHFQVFRLLVPAGALHLYIEAFREQGAPSIELGAGFRIPARQECPADIALPAAGQGDEPAGPAGEPLPLQQRLAALLAFQVTAGDERREVEIACVVAAEQRDERGLAVLSFPYAHIRPHDGLDAGILGFLVELDQREQVALVRKRHRGHTAGRRRPHEIRHAYDAVRQGIFGMQAQMDETRGHALKAFSRQRRTGPKDRRCTAHTPCTSRAARWAAVG